MKDKQEILDLLARAREITWQNWGKEIGFYLPGMIILDGQRGKYPAISITGGGCELDCDHCGARLLESMIYAPTPGDLIEKCIRLEELGNIGCLISGGCSRDGRLPWGSFIDAIAEIKRETDLIISIHPGLIDLETAKRLKDAGVDQALIDVIGDGETLRAIYHLHKDIRVIKDSLNFLTQAGVPIAPHIVVGLHYGKIRGELNALKMISQFAPAILVIVVLMPLSGTQMQGISPPEPLEVAEIIARARIEMPHTLISLGCARPRGKVSERIEVLAIDGGVNRIALWSDAAIERAKGYGLKIEFYKTCCSV